MLQMLQRKPLNAIAVNGKAAKDMRVSSSGRNCKVMLDADAGPEKTYQWKWKWKFGEHRLKQALMFYSKPKMIDDH